MTDFTVTLVEKRAYAAGLDFPYQRYEANE